MQRIGIFQIQDQFTITGRGLVVLGQLLEGVVKNGATLKFEFEGENILMQIISVEFADNVSEKKSWVGLVVANKNEREKNYMQDKKIKEQVAEIFE
ncbi:MAG: hypothetical protein HOP10_08800 [Chitinophagaceae bacterium]|nr:hypothetical protein [Chitinophagaceae bacterium]